ncbi:MAG: Gfo/Idh/MocA family oxidoreductase [Terrimicrobiaceae bacterium]
MEPEISGGIFIEHGVHFFDLFRMWFGPGQVVAAQQSERPESGGIIDQVHCTVRYGSVLLTNFYHGFHQSSRMEAQETRIVCERGTIRLFEWVPTRIEIDLLANYAELDAVRSIVPHAEVEEVARYKGGERDILARHKSFPADGRFCIPQHGHVEAGALRPRRARAARRPNPLDRRPAAPAARLRGKRPDFP